MASCPLLVDTEEVMVTAAMSTDPLAGAAADLDALSHAARDGALDAAAAVSALAAVRRLAADLERAELALSEAARSGGGTWAQIAAAMGARGRQGAQKRHVDLSRRYRRPPEVDNAATVTPVAQPAASPAAAPPGLEPARKPADRPRPGARTAARTPRGAAAEDHARDHPRAPVQAGECAEPRRVPV